MGTIQAVYSKDRTLLTSTEEVVEHYEELLKPTNNRFMVEADWGGGVCRQFP